MDQTGQHIFQFLQQYGYWLMLPLMIIEGPVATIIAATLASLGAFNIYVVVLLSILGDVLGDIVWYGLGYRYGLGFVRRFGRYFGITEKLVADLRNYFLKHGGKTIFLVKSTTGLCWATFTTAGIARMEFWKFMKYSVYGGLVWSGILASLGYFYGYLWREIKEYIDWIGWVIFGVGVVSIFFLTIYKNKQGRRMLRGEK